MSVQVTRKVPDWKGTAVMPDGEFKEISSEDYKDKWYILFFYPLDFTFVCPTEIRGYNSQIEKIKSLGGEVIGASIDSQYSHKAWIDADLGKLEFPLLADLTKQISADFGVLLEDEGIAARGTFIVDPEGVLRAQIVTEPATGRSIDESVRLLESAINPGLTGCGWQPGEDTLG